jgi:4-aminobutyrate aminotransferase-like enzyme
LSCVAALENIRVLRGEKLAEKAARQGDYIRKILSEFSKKSRLVGDVRGKGLLIGVELVKDKKTKTPATKEAGRVVEKAMQEGLLIGREGRYGQVLKLSPPLTITREETDRALSILEAVLKKTQ